jgi:4a-hydroxytetrahydrobiopterin dehydratase
MPADAHVPATTRTSSADRIAIQLRAPVGILRHVADEWAEIDDALENEFRFASFPNAIAFVNRIAELAENENHHPEIRIDGSRVTVRWWTHTASGVTERDHRLAELTNLLV